MMRRMVNRAALLTLIVVAALVALVQLDPVPVRPQKAVADQPARHASVEIPEATKQQVVVAYGKLPLSFETNQGQTDSRVKFLSRGSGYTLFLTSTEAVLALRPPRAKPSAADHGAATRPEPPAQRDVLRIRLVGANPAPQMTGLDALPGKSNYFIGKDPQKWMRNVPHYTKVNYEEVYPDIDLVFYGNQRRLEYDFVVAPSADPGAITLGFEGADRLEIDPQGDLVVHMAGGEVRFQKPVVYQELDGARQIVPGHYALNGDDRVGFQIAAYDAGKALIIDPVLAYSTYLGGSGADSGLAIAVDAAGNAYVAGSTNSIEFSATTDAIQYIQGGGYDAFVAKLDPTGTDLLFSTFFGGTSRERGRAIAVDADGNAYVTGRTGSTDFPTTAGAFQVMSSGHYDAFVTKLNAAGYLVYSTYLGGTSVLSPEGGEAIAVDSFGNAYVTGWTGSTDFPTANPIQASFGGGDYDAFVTKLNAAGDTLVYSTYLGGTSREYSFSIAVDSLGNAYVTGTTGSTDFPTTTDAVQQVHAGGYDAFVTKLNAAGDTLVYSTYLGGTSGTFPESGGAIAVDADGNAYVTGRTGSTDFPTTDGAFQVMSSGHYDAFVTKLNAAGYLVYSTYLGGSGPDRGLGIAVKPGCPEVLGASCNAYVTGRTGSTDFPTTTDAVQQVHAGNLDAFVTKLSAAGYLVYSSYLGGESQDDVSGIAVDSLGNIYVTGTTISTYFPTTEGAFQTSATASYSKRGGPWKEDYSQNTGDAFVTKVTFGIALTATGYKAKGQQTVDLKWGGATSASVGIYRDSQLIAPDEANDGFYTDNIGQKGGGTYTYQVCEEGDEGTSTCSNEATVTF